MCSSKKVDLKKQWSLKVLKLLHSLAIFLLGVLPINLCIHIHILRILQTFQSLILPIAGWRHLYLLFQHVISAFQYYIFLSHEKWIHLNNKWMVKIQAKFLICQGIWIIHPKDRARLIHSALFRWSLGLTWWYFLEILEKQEHLPLIPGDQYIQMVFQR